MAMHSLTLWLIQRCRLLRCVFLASFPSGAEWIPPPSCIQKQPFDFVPHKICSRVLVAVFKSLFSIPLLVPEQLLWSRRSKAASTISPAAFVGPSLLDRATCPALPVSIFWGVPGTKYFIVKSEALVCLLAQSLSTSQVSGEEKEVTEIRFCHIGREPTAQKRASNYALPTKGSANSDPSW